LAHLGNRDLGSCLDQAKEDQTDIYYYLNKKLDDNYELISSLETQILNEQADREIAEKIYEKKIEELEAKAAADELKANSRVNALEEKLASLREFEELKEESENKLKELLDTLERERAKFRDATEEMEIKTIRERDRLRDEQNKIIAELKAKAQSEVMAHLDEKTLETFEENERVKNELKFQSSQANQVLQISKDVVARDRELRTELELAHGAEKEMIDRLAEYQQLIKHLNERCASAEQRATVSEDRVYALQATHDKENQHYEEQLAELRRKHDSNIQDEGAMWTFLRETYTRMMVAAGSTGNLDGLDEDGNVDRARILVNLFRIILGKYPQKFRQLMRLVPKERVGSVEGTSSLPSIMSPTKLLQMSGAASQEESERYNLFHSRSNQDNSISGMQINTVDNPAQDDASMLSVEMGAKDASLDAGSIKSIGASLKTAGTDSVAMNSLELASLLQTSEGGMGQHSKISFHAPAPILKTSSTMTDERGGGVARGRTLGRAQFDFNDSSSLSGPKSQGTSYSRKVNRINRNNAVNEAQALGITSPVKGKTTKFRAPRRDNSPEADVRATSGLLKVGTVRPPGAAVRASHPPDGPALARQKKEIPVLFIQKSKPVVGELTASADPITPSSITMQGEQARMSVNPVDAVRNLIGHDVSDILDPDEASGFAGTPESSVTLSPRVPATEA